MRSLRPFTHSKEASSSSATEQFSKKETPHFILAQPAFGTQTQTGQSQ